MARKYEMTVKQFPTEIAGLTARELAFVEGTKFCIVVKGPALAEIYVNDSFALMYRRTNSATALARRTFQVVDSSYEVLPMTHDELLAKVNGIAASAE